MSRGGTTLVNEKRMKRILKMYSDIFDVVPNPDSKDHPGVTIYYKNREYISAPVLFKDIRTTVSFGKRIFVADSSASPVKYSDNMSLSLTEKAGGLYIRNKAKLSDEFCIALDNYNIVIHNTVSETDPTPLYDMVAIRRRHVLNEIINER